MAYNLTRETQAILSQHESSPPSFSVQLYHDNWTLNSGPKFLYNTPTFAALFDDIKANRIPVDLLELFDAAKVPFYEGCMIVEIEEFKQTNSKESKSPEKTTTRVLLRPNSETLFADLCLLNQKAGSKWTDQDALEVEAKILLATSPPLCLDPDPRLGKIANSLYRISLPRTPPPLRPKKRKAKSLQSTEEDEASWNRKAKIIRFMDPKPTRSTTASYRLLDHLTQMKAAPPPSAENNAAIPGVNYDNPLRNMSTTHVPTQPPASQPQPQTHTQTSSQPQPQSQSQPQQPQSQSQPQPQPPAQPPLQPQPQSQPLQSQPPPRSTATPVVAAPSTPGSTDTKKSTPKPATKRNQTPGDGTLGTPTPSATPVQSTPKLPPQSLRSNNRPTSRPTSQSPHPTATASAATNGLASSPVAPSSGLHPMARPASHNSPRPPTQPAAQPAQGQPQPQLQNQIQQPRPFPQQMQMKGFVPPPQGFMAPGMAAHYKQLAAQAQSQNPKAGVMGQQALASQTQQAQIFYLHMLQAQAQAHAQGQGQTLGQAQGVALAQARYSALPQAQQQQQQQPNGQATSMSHPPVANPGAASARGNPQSATHSPIPNANGQGQHATPQHFAASGQSQQSPQQSHQQQQQQLMARAQYAAQLQHQQHQQQQHYPGQTQDATQPSQIPLPQHMQMQLNRLQAQQAQYSAHAGGRVPYDVRTWPPQLQMAAFRQSNGGQQQPLTAAQVKAAQQAQHAHAQAHAQAQAQSQAQSQGAGAR